MSVTRRESILLSAAAIGSSALSSCASVPQAISQPVVPKPLGGLGVIVVQDGKRILEHVTGFASGLDDTENMAKRPFLSSTPFRAASMSKVVVLMTARAMAKTGQLDLNVDISEPLGRTLRNRDYADQPVTLQNVLSHRSGISDPAVYWTMPDGDIRDLLSPDMFNGGRPGDWLEYANINYGIAATVMEIVSGERFDQLTKRYVLEPLGLDAGFNWAGVSNAKRQSGATLYRKVEGRIKIQTDGPDMLMGKGPIFYGDNPDYSIEDYVPGTNGTLLSPQGGLRASLDDLLVIAKALANETDLHTEDWRYNGHNGAADDGHFVSFGPGLYVYPPDLSPIKGQRMVGHHGSAYGLFGGLWHLPQLNAQIVHVVTATPEPPKPKHIGPPAIAAESRVLMDVAMAALGLA